MKAGTTKHDVDTKIKIISSADDDEEIIGLTGRITHPFPGLMWPNVKYIAGVYLDKKGVFQNDIMNLTKEDQFEVIP